MHNPPHCPEAPMYCMSCGTANPDQGSFSRTCGKPMATPAGQAAAGLGAYRSGGRMVVPKGAVLPGYCVKCGEPVTGEFYKKKFHWHSPWIYILAVSPI